MDVPAAVTAFVDAAKAYTTAAAESTGAFDASLAAQLEALPSMCDAAVAALLSASTSPEIAEAVRRCEVLLADAAALGTALLSQQAPMVTWVVPRPLPLAAIVQPLYGSATVSRLGEVTRNNPHVLGLPLVPAGTRLLLASV